jgi:hypothetical protein
MFCNRFGYIGRATWYGIKSKVLVKDKKNCYIILVDAEKPLHGRAYDGH